jgi:predicted enzyme related to lactoylglutathione lyase
VFRVVPQLTVVDISRSVQFYRDNLGFTLTIEDPPEAPVFAALEREDVSLFLVSESSREEPYQVEDLANHKRGVGVRLYFEVDDAREIYEQSKFNEVTVLRDLTYNDREDYTEFSIADPDGYEIGIYS